MTQMESMKLKNNFNLRIYLQNTQIFFIFLYIISHLLLMIINLFILLYFSFFYNKYKNHDLQYKYIRSIEIKELHRSVQT